MVKKLPCSWRIRHRQQVKMSLFSWYFCPESSMMALIREARFKSSPKTWPSDRVLESNFWQYLFFFVAFQLGEDTFNRAKLLNVGYTEALKDAEYDCFIFSDVDLIPMDDRNLYHCYDQPRHFAIAMDKFGFR